MKQKLLFSFLALFVCIFSVSASDYLNDIFKKYQKCKGEEIVCSKIDLRKELKKAKAGETDDDIDVDQLQQSIDLGFRKMEVLVCFRLGNMFEAKPMFETLNSESTDEFIKDFARIREKMMNDNKLSHIAVNKTNCNVDCFLPVSEATTIKEGYLLLKMINGSVNCIIHFHGKLKTEDVIKSIEDGTFIGIDGFEPTLTVVEE